MMLSKFGPRRLSPSLVVWQVRHAFLQIDSPDPASTPRAPAPGAPADDDFQQNQECRTGWSQIATRSMKASISECVPL